MPTLPTLPRRSPLERVLLVCAGALVVIGISAWSGGWLRIMQSLPEYAPMGRTEAAAFILFGLVVFARLAGWRTAEWLGLLPAVLALPAIAYGFLGRGGAQAAGIPSEPIWDLFGPAGRMATLTAVGVLLGAVPLCLHAWKRELRYCVFCEVAVGSLLVGVAISTLLGYWAGQAAVFNWGDRTPIAPLTAVALLFLGLCLLMLAWRDDREAGPAAWAPMTAIVVPLMATMTLWIGLREREIAYADSRTQAAMDKFLQAADASIEHQLGDFERFARKWADAPSETDAAREADAAVQMGESGPLGCVSIELVDSAGTTRTVIPRTANAVFNESAVAARRAVMDQAKKDGRTAISATTDVMIVTGDTGNRGPGFVLAAPIARPGQETAFVTAEFLYETFFSAVADEQLRLGEDYHFSVSIAGAPVFDGGSVKAPGDLFTVNRAATLFDRRLYLTAAPSAVELAQDLHPMASLALISGLSLTALLGLSVSLARGAALGRRAAEHSNRRLREENEERRRVEDRLKVSDERLRLALDSTEIGIFEWDLPSGRVFYSAGLWAMLGYDPEKMPATLDTWQSLLHPDDVPGFDSRTQALRQGTPATVSSESRIRSSTGDWRWIYTRAKCVSFDPGRRRARVIGTVQDVTSRVEFEHQLRRAKSEADAASRAKSEFLASMSHEIRTPLNGIIGMTSLMMDTELAASQRDYVETIRSSSDALLEIVNEILDFSKIESGKMEIEHVPFALTPCLEEALDLVAKTAAGKNLEIGYCVAPDVPQWITGDATRLWQVISNLVNNGVKFTANGSVSVDVRRGASAPAGRICLEFAVRDTGIGIAPERMNRLFKPFSQGDSSTTRRFGGTGLGLAICERLCSLMGGGVRVESTPDVGSTFTFTILTDEAAPPADSPGPPPLPAALGGSQILCVSGNSTTRARMRSLLTSWGVQPMFAPDPLAAAAMAGLKARPALLIVDQAALATESLLDELKVYRCPALILVPFGRAPIPSKDPRPIGVVSKPLKNAAFFQEVIRLLSDNQKAEPVEASDDARLAAEYPLKVLLAEDNLVNQKVAMGLLARLGYHADLAANGLQAIAMMEKQAYDLVLMDLQMPEMDGLEACREIHARFPLGRIPKIIALTANALNSDRDRCLAAGMDDYVSKPVKLQEIAAAIRRQFGHLARPAESRDS
jgi:PAS domain S-box-containing protein